MLQIETVDDFLQAVLHLFGNLAGLAYVFEHGRREEPNDRARIRYGGSRGGGEEQERQQHAPERAAALS